MDFPFEISKKTIFKYKRITTFCSEQNEYKNGIGYENENFNLKYRYFQINEEIEKEIVFEMIIYFDKFEMNLNFNENISINVVTSDHPYALVLARNFNIINIYIYPDPSTNILADFSLTNHPNKNKIFHQFELVFDIEISGVEISKIKKLDLFLYNAFYFFFIFN